MKLKLNLNVDSAKRMLVLHGEKAAFGLAVCALLWFLWTTLKLDVLPAEKEPGPLTALAEQTRQHVVDSVWDPDAKNIKIVDYPVRAEHVPLNDGDYPPLVVFLDKPLWEQHEKRPVPKVLPVEELLAVASHGLLAVKKQGEEAGNEPHAVGGATGSKAHGAKLTKDLASKGFFYVSVTGLVPLRKQIAAYDEAFRSALKYDPVKDRPSYEDIKVERAAITGNNPTKAVWEEIDLAAADAITATWSPEPISDVVDEEYIDAAYTWPLGPLLGEDWDPAVVGHPKIPPVERLDQTKKPEKEVVAAPVEQGAGRRARRAGAKSGSAAAKPNAASQPAKATAASTKREQKLFRFIDYTVKPGKQYRYRVKLTLANPNQGKEDRFLKDPALSHTPTLETDWSEPTPVVTVPRGINIYAGPVYKPTPTPSHDPEVEVCVVNFDPQRGGEPTKKKIVQRGALLNFSEKDLKVLSGDRNQVVQWEKVDILTNTLIVDVQGGRKLGTGKKALMEPTEILVLDADGRASVHDELDDAEGFHSRLDPLEHPERPETTAPEPRNPYEGLNPRGGSRPSRTPRAAPTRTPRTPAN